MFKKRKNIIQIVFILLGIVYIIKLFSLQILDSSYKLASRDNVRRRIIDYPFRGLIYDRNGKWLVYNTSVFDLMVVPRELKIKDTAIFCERFGLTKEAFIKKMTDAKAYSRAKPSAFMKQLSTTDFAKIQDFLVDYKGIYPQQRTIRAYPHHALANALGYIGEVSPKQLEKQTDGYYQQGDYIGINGLELEYEHYLRGKRGARYVMVDVRGVEKGTYKNGIYDTLSIPGANLTASVDLDLQKYGETLMKYKIGSVVAIEPSSGEILSIISAPSYDPNKLTGRNFSENYAALEKDSLVPLFNRPLMAKYPPGSIFKIAQALIALNLGVITPATTFPCNKALINCHHHPSPQDVSGAIQYSCNPFFYMTFKHILEQGKDPNKYQDSEIGFRKWYNQIRKFGFGQKLGVDLPNETRGAIPSNAYYDHLYGHLRWKFSTVYSLSIGQGEIGVTPIQMANLAAIVANKGFFYSPHMIKSIGNKGALPQYKVKHSLGIDKQYFKPVIDGMEQVVLGGTGMIAKIKDIAVCGKTGTAQNPHGKDHSVFIAFAPKDNPKIAIAVFIENAGFGASWAAPIASLMIEKYLTDTITRPRLEKYILDKKFYTPKGETEIQNKKLKPKAPAPAKKTPKPNAAVLKDSALLNEIPKPKALIFKDSIPVTKTPKPEVLISKDSVPIKKTDKPNAIIPKDSSGKNKKERRTN